MVSHKITYTPGQLHAVKLDDNTVALVMPLDYAATVRDVCNVCTGNDNVSRRKYTSLLWTALNRLEGMPEYYGGDMVGRGHRQQPGIYFNPNEAVKL